MRKLTIIGKYCTKASKEEAANGQTVKTEIVTNELKNTIGADNVYCIDTFGWKKHPAMLFLKSVWAVWNSQNVIFMPDEGGIKVFPRLLRAANLGGKCKLHYYVVGGWLSAYLDRSAKGAADLKKLDAVYVEVPAMRQELEERGFTNVVLVNKFRRMEPAMIEDIDLNPHAPYKLCYFSRVMREKGIEECIEAVKEANQRAGFEKYTLDIYGSINEDYREDFETLQKTFPSYIRYGGIVAFQESVKVLKDYFAMLFPTHYASEGYPNAIVDAFAAGLPVIATKWHYNADIINDHHDGILVEVGKLAQLVDAFEEIAGDSALYQHMRRNCITRFEEYLPEKAIAKVIAELK